MKFIFSVILLLIPPGVLAKHFTSGDPTKISCAPYACSRIPGSYCLGTGSSEVVYASACPAGTYCSLEGVCTGMKQKYQDNAAYPGEYCDSETPCKYGNCNSGMCDGKKNGELCGDHGECEAGLRCHHTCKPLFKAKQRGCLSDLDCTSDSGCNFGECTAYFSMKPKSPVEKCENLSNYMCASSMCDNGKCLAEQYSDKYPKECLADSDCQSNGGYFVGCICGLNSEAKSYCLPFPGDSIGREYFTLLKQWVDSRSVLKCNTSRRFAVHCMKSYWNQCKLIEYIYRAYRYQFFPTLIDNPVCVEQSLTQDYWEIREIYKRSGKESECRFPYEL